MTDLPTLLSRATPGPWSVHRGLRGAPFSVVNYDGDAEIGTWFVSGVQWGPDAALIALAPQLAAALIEAHKAMTELQRDMLERSRAGIDAIHGEEYRIVNAGRTAWHDFCATLSRIDAIMKPGGGALKGD